MTSPDVGAIIRNVIWVLSELEKNPTAQMPYGLACALYALAHEAKQNPIVESVRRGE